MSMIRRHFHDLPVEARQAIADKAGPSAPPTPPTEG
ncbi:hypothetical protein SUDANB9_04180 [Streptomyces sp. enrichment culture]